MPFYKTKIKNKHKCFLRSEIVFQSLKIPWKQLNSKTLTKLKINDNNINY